MATVHQSQAAEADLTNIWYFIAVENVAAANRLLATIQEKSLLLAELPEMGVKRADLGDNIRIHVIDKYVICYRPAVDGIELVRVLHGARDLPDEFNVST